MTEVQAHSTADSGACPTAQPWQCVLCNTSKTPMRRNHPVHGPKTLCNACGVRLSRRVKADRNKASERGTSAGGIKPVRTALRQVKPSAPLDEVPRTRTERKRSARALDALGLSPDDPEATAHKVSVPSPARAKTARLGPPERHAPASAGDAAPVPQRARRHAAPACARDAAAAPDATDLRWLRRFNASHGSPTHSRTYSSSCDSSEAFARAARGLPDFSRACDPLSEDQFATTLALLDSFASSRGYAVDEAAAQNLLTARADAPPWHVARAVYLYWRQKRSPADAAAAALRAASPHSTGTAARWHPALSASGGVRRSLDFDAASEMQAALPGLRIGGERRAHPLHDSHARGTMGALVESALQTVVRSDRGLCGTDGSLPASLAGSHSNFGVPAMGVFDTQQLDAQTDLQESLLGASLLTARDDACAAAAGTTALPRDDDALFDTLSMPDTPAPPCAASPLPEPAASPSAASATAGLDLNGLSHVFDDDGEDASGMFFLVPETPVDVRWEQIRQRFDEPLEAAPTPHAAPRASIDAWLHGVKSATPRAAAAAAAPPPRAPLLEWAAPSHTAAAAAAAAATAQPKLTRDMLAAALGQRAVPEALARDRSVNFCGATIADVLAAAPEPPRAPAPLQINASSSFEDTMSALQALSQGPDNDAPAAGGRDAVYGCMATTEPVRGPAGYASSPWCLGY